MAKGDADGFSLFLELRRGRPDGFEGDDQRKKQYQRCLGKPVYHPEKHFHGVSFKLKMTSRQNRPVDM
jgi:hypothetical protein